mmetsp:Transcript_24018/g.49056  ORF Transcript_24018/g.49056 Transcript_24018/m.49056 type:complete len:80 (+) Transcript_24018:25-264(+)
MNVPSKEKKEEHGCHVDTERVVTPRRLFHDDDDDDYNDKLEDAGTKETHDKLLSTEKHSSDNHIALRLRRRLSPALPLE